LKAQVQILAKTNKEDEGPTSIQVKR
jgi:hypothetical protein